MKKFLALIACAALSISLLAGCGGKPNNSNPPSNSGSPSASDSSTSNSTPAETYTIKLAVIPGNVAAEDSPDIMYSEVLDNLA